MPKKIFNRLTVKVFIISFVVQVLSGLLICLALYSQTPEMMYSPKDELDDLILELSNTSKEDGAILIDDFIRRTGMNLAFFDASSYDRFRVNKPLDGFGTRTISTTEEYYEVLGSDAELGTYGVTFKDDPGEYLLQYFDRGENINLIPRAVHKSYPLMIVIVVSLSLLSSFIYAYIFARPVRKLSEASQKMATTDLSVRCDDRRGDEIGDLARDLNTMAEALARKIDELQEEIDRVKELESQKEMFFAAASHELKTPVTILEGHLTGMLEGVEPYQDHDKYLSRSLRTCKQMESLINEILIASKMQSAGDVVMSEVDLSGLLRSKIEDSEDLFVIRNITVKKDIEDGLLIKGNRDLTSLAVGAFISNAVFYSAEGSSIRISSHKAEDRIITVIENDSAHIDEKDMDHLFEPFYRSDASRSSGDGGSGLGLYIARLIITGQGGTCALCNTDLGVRAEIILNSI